jgi:putative membrane protein
MNSPLLQLLARWLVLALGVTLATKIVPGISYADGATLFAVVVLLSFFNLILKPLLLLFTLPFIILTMGLGVLVINALLFLFVGEVVRGFQVDGFWSAVGGSLVVSVTNMLANAFLRGGTVRRASPPRPAPTDGPASGAGPVARSPRPKPDDVIDI